MSLVFVPVTLLFLFQYSSDYVAISIQYIQFRNSDNTEMLLLFDKDLCVYYKRNSDMCDSEGF